MNSILTLEKALEIIEEVAFDGLKRFDTLRNETAVPDPNTVENWLFAISHEFFKPCSDFNTGSTSIPNLVRTMHREWVEDYDCRGFLDDNEFRSVSSPCGINSHCWSNIVYAFGICCADAMAECVEACYPKYSDRVAKRGPVRSRKFGCYGVKPRGRPKKVGGNQSNVPARPVGRPRKVTKRRNGNLVITTNTARESTGMPRGRPKGKKDSPKSKRGMMHAFKAKQRKARKEGKKKPLFFPIQ